MTAIIDYNVYIAGDSVAYFHAYDGRQTSFMIALSASDLRKFFDEHVRYVNPIEYLDWATPCEMFK